MRTANFTIRVLRANPHRPKSHIWRAGQIVTGMEGCRVEHIIQALTYLEQDRSEVGLGDPARWLTHFAGLESAASGKALDPWIEIIHGGEPLRTTASYRELIRAGSIGEEK